VLATVVCGCASLWLTPLAIRDTTRIAKKLIADQLTAAVQPRVFDEQFPNTILYIGDIKTGPVVVWRDIFLADLTPPEERTKGMKEQAEGPRVTTAREALAIPDVPNRRLQLSLRSATTHEMAKDGVDYTSYMPRGEQALEAVEKNEAPERPFKEMPTPELYRYTKTRAKNTERREIERLYLGDFPGVLLLLPGVHRAGWAGEAADAAGGDCAVDSECSFRGGRPDLHREAGIAGRPGHHRHRARWFRQNHQGVFEGV